MPLTWTIDPQHRLVTAVAEGEIRRVDVDAYLDAVDAAGAVNYRKLFDGTHGNTRMGSGDMLALGVRMRASHAAGPMGALALVLPEHKAELVTRLLGILAAAERPMRVFRKIAAARKWINGQPQ